MANDSQIQVHEDICNYLSRLYISKNDDYGDSFKRVRDKVPNAILVRLYDKIYRLEKLLDTTYEQKVKDESIEDTLLDLANYAIMELTERKMDDLKEKTNPSPQYLYENPNVVNEDSEYREPAQELGYKTLNPTNRSFSVSD